MKAFDCVRWKYLAKSLLIFGFGEAFCSWIKLLYDDIGSHIIVIGRLTSRIKLGRGVCRGCPLSPMLYVLSLEPLAAAIRRNPSIRGIPTFSDADRETIQLTCYADDMTSFVCDDVSFGELDKQLSLYEEASGAKLNRLKSVGLWLGQCANRTDSPLEIKWQTTKLKIIGLFYCPSYYDSVRKNWSVAIQKLQNYLQKWTRRDLSIFGRAKVLNLHALTKITIRHILSLCPKPHVVK
ncbi:uncharacterized protein LOC134192145 [Corticium candelabrum]|uniref:uncharacterized protein LOC134192145 n=1 Tax=Corticium candelabrum TaxID=121492 RepID=UPI002E256F99|nr:uncharacterized protein LOC134192145 [Corticium candelabrum]